MSIVMMEPGSIRMLQKRTEGFTLVEMLIASAVGGVLLLVPAYLLQVSGERQQKTQRRLESLSHNQIGMRFFLNQVENSQIMRSGLVSCSGADGDGAQVLTLPQCTPTQSQESCNSSEVSLMDGRRLDFAFLLHSVIANVFDAGAGVFQVPDGDWFGEGSLVVLSLLHRPEISGIFRVSALERGGAAGSQRSRITLNPVQSAAELGPQGQFSCRGPNQPLSVSEIILSPGGQIYGQTPSTVRIEKLGLASYSLIQDSQRPGTRALQAKWWPLYGESRSAESIATTTILSGVSKFAAVHELKLKSSFVTDASSSLDLNALGGVYALEVSGKHSSGNGESPIFARANYHMARSLLSNFAAQTSTAEVGFSDPVICGLNLERKSGIRLNVHGRYVNLYKLTGTSSYSGTQILNVKIEGVPGARDLPVPQPPPSSFGISQSEFSSLQSVAQRVGCFTQYILNSDGTPNLNPPHPLTESPADFLTQFDLALDGQNAQQAWCVLDASLNGGLVVTSSQTYWDETLKKTRVQSCVNASNVPPGKVIYNVSDGTTWSNAKCKKSDGSWSVPRFSAVPYLRASTGSPEPQAPLGAGPVLEPYCYRSDNEWSDSPPQAPDSLEAVRFRGLGMIESYLTPVAQGQVPELPSGMIEQFRRFFGLRASSNEPCGANSPNLHYEVRCDE